MQTYRLIDKEESASQYFTSISFCPLFSMLRLRFHVEGIKRFPLEQKLRENPLDSVRGARCEALIETIVPITCAFSLFAGRKLRLCHSLFH
jgi:hypothetical protein